MIWGPKICCFQRKINKKKVYNKSVDIYERAVTYEGPEWFSRNVAL